MPPARRKTPGSSGVSGTREVDVAALVAQLSEEVRRVGPRTALGGASSVRVNARAAAERLWRVSADRPPPQRPGLVGAVQRPVKFAVRKLVRFYVEPVFADQRAFNSALLKLVDDLYAENERLRAELARHAGARGR